MGSRRRLRPPRWRGPGAAAPTMAVTVESKVTAQGNALAPQKQVSAGELRVYGGSRGQTMPGGGWRDSEAGARKPWGTTQQAVHEQ